MGNNTDFDFGWNAREDAPTYACLGRVTCAACGKLHGYCSEIGAQPAPQGDNMDLGSHRQKDRGTKGKFVNRPFLKAKDIPAKGGLKCKVIDFRVAPKQMEYSNFLMDVSAGKREFTVGLRSQSVLLDMICDELGTKTEKFPGKSITFVRGGSKGQYINVG